MKSLKIPMIIATIATLSGCTSSSVIAQKSNSKNDFSNASPQMNNVSNNSTNNFSSTDSEIVSSGTQISRYVTEKDTPTNAEINPLAAVSTFVFQASVVTVGDAVNQVLVTSGYQLAPHLNHTVKATLQQPLPITDRQLGPMPIQSALEVLMGEEVYQLEQDPLHRLVSFKVRPSIKNALGENLNE